MSDLYREIIKGSYKQPDLTRYVTDEIRWAMRPFDPLRITLEVHDRYLIDGPDKQQIVIRVKTIPGYEFVWWFDPTIVAAMENPEFFAQEVGMMAGEYFRNFRIEPEAHIILGEY